MNGLISYRRIGTFDDPEKQLLLAQKQDISRENHHPISVQLRNGIQEETWRCAVCQYLNRGSGDRCSMCNVARIGNSMNDKSPMTDYSLGNMPSRDSGEVPVIETHPVIKTSKIGTGMKLKKSVEVELRRKNELQRRSLPKKQTVPEPKVESRDIFSEVGLDVKYVRRERLIVEWM